MIRLLTISYLNVKQGRKNKKKLEENIYVNNNKWIYIFVCVNNLLKKRKKILINSFKRKQDTRCFC